MLADCLVTLANTTKSQDSTVKLSFLGAFPSLVKFLKQAGVAQKPEQHRISFAGNSLAPLAGELN